MQPSYASNPQSSATAEGVDSRVSALFDDRIEAAERATLKDWIDAPDTVRRWREYALIGDALRGDAHPTGQFMARLEARLAAEPTVLAPLRPAAPRLRQVYWLAAAAAVAAIAWTVLSAAPDTPGTLPMARAPGSGEIVPVGLGPEAIEPDFMLYLAAHQDFAHAIILPPSDMRYTPVSFTEARR